MNAVNNGPLPLTEERTRSNFESFKTLHIPYARTHDAAFCAEYGGEHSVDVNFIFPDFSADENDPNSYDFTLTDEYLKTMFDAGTEPFFRLGSKIEHWSKKYNTRKPSDYDKWARICEHIIAHYTEGWANGHKWHIDYWEIWNEADGQPDDAPPEKKDCWSGTMQEFFELYKVAAIHLKNRFPHLKIGGPACCGVDMWKGLIVRPWVDSFLKYVRDNHVPLDFFSWHGYTDRAESFVRSAKIARKVLDQYGFTSTESILNEWNLGFGWSFGWRNNAFAFTVNAISDIRGATFIASMMIGCQNAPVDMLMYYDARPSLFNGMFDFYTQKPLKGYYPFVFFDRLKEMGTRVHSDLKGRFLYALAAEGKGKKGMMIAYYPPIKKKSKAKKIVIRAHLQPKEALILDEHHTLSSYKYTVKNGKIALYLQPYSVLYLEE